MSKPGAWGDSGQNGWQRSGYRTPFPSCATVLSALVPRWLVHELGDLLGYQPYQEHDNRDAEH